jgi:hypothetical protein
MEAIWFSDTPCPLRTTGRHNPWDRTLQKCGSFLHYTFFMWHYHSSADSQSNSDNIARDMVAWIRNGYCWVMCIKGLVE